MTVAVIRALAMWRLISIISILTISIIPVPAALAAAARMTFVPSAVCAPSVTASRLDIVPPLSPLCWPSARRSRWWTLCLALLVAEPRRRGASLSLAVMARRWAASVAELSSRRRAAVWYSTFPEGLFASALAVVPTYFVVRFMVLGRLARWLGIRCLTMLGRSLTVVRGALAKARPVSFRLVPAGLAAAARLIIVPSAICAPSVTTSRLGIVFPVSLLRWPPARRSQWWTSCLAPLVAGPRHRGASSSRSVMARLRAASVAELSSRRRAAVTSLMGALLLPARTSPLVSVPSGADALPLPTYRMVAPPLPSMGGRLSAWIGRRWTVRMALVVAEPRCRYTALSIRLQG